MGYFDDAIDAKKDMTQETSDMTRFAGNAYWYSIGSLGTFLTGAGLCLALLLTNNFSEALKPIFSMLVGGVPLVLAIVFALLGIIYGLKAQRSASKIRQKNVLKNVAIAYSLLWMMLSILCLSLNLVFNIQAIIATL